MGMFHGTGKIHDRQQKKHESLHKSNKDTQRQRAPLDEPVIDHGGAGDIAAETTPYTNGDAPSTTTVSSTSAIP